MDGELLDYQMVLGFMVKWRMEEKVSGVGRGIRDKGHGIRDTGKGDCRLPIDGMGEADS